jgi:hypothetical protein
LKAPLVEEEQSEDVLKKQIEMDLDPLDDDLSEVGEFSRKTQCHRPDCLSLGLVSLVSV